MPPIYTINKSAGIAAVLFGSASEAAELRLLVKRR